MIDFNKSPFENGHAAPNSNGAYTNGHDKTVRLALEDFGALNTDPTKLNPRGWLLGTWFCRQLVSSLVGDGASGKTALRIAAALSLATGRKDILGLHVFQRVPVIYLCFEDGKEELYRRLWAAMLYHNITNADIAGYLHIQAITDADMRFTVAGSFGTTTNGPLRQALEIAITETAAGLVILDPFVKTHGSEENSNTAMDLVIAQIADLATTQNVALDIPMHTRKGLLKAGDADAARGASSVKDGGRLVYTNKPMSNEEAEQYGLDDPLEIASLMRIDNAKVNPFIKNPNPAWFQLVGVSLGNTNVNPLYPAGDNVQTVKIWNPPENQISKPDAVKILTLLETGKYSPRKGSKAADWAIDPIIDHTGKSEKQAKAIYDDWKKNKFLRERKSDPDEHGNTPMRVFINPPKISETFGPDWRTRYSHRAPSENF